MGRFKSLIILSILCLAVNSYAFNMGIMGTGGSVPCDDSGVTDCTTNSHGYNIGTTFNQLIQSYGIQKTICQVDVMMDYDAGGSGDAHIEIWDTSTTTQYGDDSDSVTINVAAGAPAVFNFTWSGVKPTVPSGDFRVYVVEESGDLEVRDSASVDCYLDTNYDAWNSGADINIDAYLQIYTQ